MLKILQARFQQYMNHDLPDVQAGFRKGRGTRDQIANIRWIMEKARVPEKNIISCLFQLPEAVHIFWLLALYHCHLSFRFTSLSLDILASLL